MKEILSRRRCLAGLAGSAALSLGTRIAEAQQTDWNGTWAGGWQAGHGMQLIFAGNDLIAVYWEDDYVSDARAVLSQDGMTVTITWGALRAVLTHATADAANIVIRETGRPDTAIALKRDP